MAHQGARLTVSDGLYSLGGAGKPGINVIPIYDLWVRLGKALIISASQLKLSVGVLPTLSARD